MLYYQLTDVKTKEMERNFQLCTQDNDLVTPILHQISCKDETGSDVFLACSKKEKQLIPCLSLLSLRYQVLAGIIEQRILEPLLQKNKLILSAAYFAVRTGNTYWGSLL